MRPILISALCLIVSCALAQQYPEPEYINEVYLLNKDSMKLERLEKHQVSMETKTKLGGFAGAEYGYYLEGVKSTVRISGGDKLYFVYYLNAGKKENSVTDSILKANNIDNSQFQGDMNDPLTNTKLYSAGTAKGQRKFLLQDASIYTKSKKDASFSYSIKKIRDGYYELSIDKKLPKGEYGFVIAGSGAMYMQATIFCFGVD